MVVVCEELGSDFLVIWSGSHVSLVGILSSNVTNIAWIWRRCDSDFVNSDSQTDDLFVF
jgi:hypothetical protein